MRKFLSVVFVFLISTVLFACPIPQQQVEPQAPNDTEYCGIACAHLLRLEGRDGHPGCEEARVLELPDGDILTCEQFCQQIQSKGKSICPSGWLTITSCEEIEKSRDKCNAKM